MNTLKNHTEVLSNLKDDIKVIEDKIEEVKEDPEQNFILLTWLDAEDILKELKNSFDHILGLRKKITAKNAALKELCSCNQSTQLCKACLYRNFEN